MSLCKDRDAIYAVPVGTRTDSEAGAVNCSLCPTGRSIDDTKGSSFCLDCRPGTFSDVSDSFSCSPCRAKEDILLQILDRPNVLIVQMGEYQDSICPHSARTVRFHRMHAQIIWIARS